MEIRIFKLITPFLNKQLDKTSKIRTIIAAFTLALPDEKVVVALENHSVELKRSFKNLEEKLADEATRVHLGGGVRRVYKIQFSIQVLLAEDAALDALGY